MTQQQTVTEPETKAKLPENFESYVKEKTRQNGGRPHFLQQLALAGKNPLDETLNVVEEAWVKNKPLRLIAKKYPQGYYAVYRLLQDLEPFKDELVAYLERTPRRKQFFNPKTGVSDYESVQLYIKRARRDGLRGWKRKVAYAELIWKGFKYRDPEHWTADEFLDFIADMGHGARSNYLDAVRVIAPQFADKRSPHYIATGRFREKLARRKKDLFGKELKLIRDALNELGLKHERELFDLHLTLGAREGSRGKAGMCGLTWSNFKDGFQRVDLYESKVRGGITWEDCPVDLFFPHLPEEMRGLWESRGKPTTEPVIAGGYTELINAYKTIRRALRDYYQGKLDPSLYHELMTLRPHDADKVHCNLLWEAGVPLEVVAGEYLGQGRGKGLCGRGWLDVNTITKHYLSLTHRSERFQLIVQKVRAYSRQFNGRDA